MQMLNFQLLQASFIQMRSVCGPSCFAIRAVFLEMVQEIWPDLCLFSGVIAVN